MKFEISNQQLANLGEFLNRVQLKGGEVNAFIELAGVFKNPIKEEKEVSGETEKKEEKK